MTTPITPAAAGSAPSKVKCTLTVTADGRWTRNGKFFSPLELYAVECRGAGGDLVWFDFLEGRWVGAYSPTTVTCNRAFAESVAANTNAKIRGYSLVSHPVAEG